MTNFLAFSTGGNIVKLLGDQLITNETIALVELVKNSYDADATKVEIIFEHNPNRIIIRDNGCGMSKSDIENGWGKIGISTKRNYTITPKFKRPILGEKGVGRFASQKLGNKLTINTRHSENSFPIQVCIDWNLFSLDRDLSSIKFPFKQINKSLKFKIGTELIIDDLSTYWDKKKIININNNLQNLLHPKDKELGLFKIEILASKYPNLEDEIIKVEDLLKLVPFYIKGSVDTKLKDLSYDFIFQDHTGNKTKSNKIINLNRIISEEINCGNFNFEIWCWETKRRIMKKFGIDSSDMTILESLSGVRIYRDGFRVFSYGNPDNDWLRLDQKRYQKLGVRLSNKQILGLLSITKQQNPKLIDKTDREGIVDIPEMRLLSEISEIIITNLEAERQKYYTSKIKPLDTESDSIIKNLKTIDNKVTKLSKSDNIKKEEILEVKTELKKAISSVDTYFKDLVEPLYIHASVSTVFSVPLHEIKEFIDKIYYLVKELINEFDKIPKKLMLNMLKEIKEHLDSMISVVIDTNVVLKGSKIEDVSLKYIIDYVLKLYDTELHDNKIEIINEIDDITIKSRKNQLVSIFMNILNNSLYWVKCIENPEPKIKLFTKNTSDNKVIIIFSDNGPGFIDPPEVLTSPFFSRKPNGSGLGLYLSNMLAKRLGGQLIFNLSKYEKLLLSGASIGLEIGD